MLRRAGAVLALLWTALGMPAAQAQNLLIQQGPMKQQRGAAVASAWHGAATPVAPSAAALVGQRIYETGVLPSGAPLRAVRYGQALEGSAAACVNCHRASGLGSVEGNIQISPITGRYLFDQDRRAVVQMNLRAIKSFNERHPPYTAESLAAALRDGQHVTGRAMHELMPRYQLGDGDVAALEAYLRHLSSTWSPGVTDRSIRFATVITPDVDPARRKVFLETLRAAVAQKNGNFVPGQRSMSSAAEMVLGTERFWELDVWQLEGRPDQWPAQLSRLYAKQPVFALVSGLGQGTWSPVHQFCERQSVPCWFPSIEAPPAESEADRYSIYFSRGVELEAAVLAQHLAAMSPRPARVVQLATDDASGRAGAQALTSALQGLGITAETRKVKGVAPVVDPGLQSADAVVGWLRPGQLAVLDGTPPPAGQLYLSGFLTHGDVAQIPAAWRDRTHVVYPFQLPVRRQAALVYFKQWLQVRQIDLADEVLQSEVYFAMNYLNDTLVEMLDNVHRDYLLERAESMLSLREASKAEDEARELVLAKPHAGAVDRVLGSRPIAQREVIPRPLPGRTENAVSRTESTTVYPRLSLGPGQRIASKGAQIVRFSADLQTLIPETPWIVPNVP